MRIKLFLLLCILALLAACNPDVDEPVANKRALFFYLAGDNNLSGEVAEKEAALKKGWNSSMGELYVFADEVGKTPALLKMGYKGGVNVLDTLQKYSDNKNSASAELLSKVIQDVRNQAPQSKFGFVVFSHAWGWLPAGAFENPHLHDAQTRSLILDGREQMPFSQFRDAIPANFFDFIVYDMCFMGGVETGYAMKDKVLYIIASAAEILSPGFTPIYQTSLDKLYADNPDLTGFADDFYHYFVAQKNEYRSATISVVKTSELTKLAEIVKSIYPNIADSEISQIQHYDRRMTTNLFFDLGDFIKNTATSAQFQVFDAQLRRSVIYKNTTGRIIALPINHYSGLSVFIPQQTTPWLNRSYKDTEWWKDTR